MRLGLAVLAAAGAVILVATPRASATITIGADLSFGTVTATACTGCTTILLAHPTSQVTSPIDGVAVRFRIRKGVGDSGAFSLRLFRPVGGGAFTAVGKSPAAPTAGTGIVPEFPVRLPIRAGDHIGMDDSMSYVTRHPVAGAVTGTFAPGYPEGAPPAVPFVPFPDEELLINADIEPDCDGDGFGDETQDADISSCPQPDTAPPESTITKGPKDRTKKKRATFEFSGTDARTVAAFECSLDGGTFVACTSPHVVTVKKGKHTFSVRAVDDSGNADGTPATYDWKVKKKRKRK